MAETQQSEFASDKMRENCPMPDWLWYNWKEVKLYCSHQEVDVEWESLANVSTLLKTFEINPDKSVAVISIGGRDVLNSIFSNESGPIVYWYRESFCRYYDSGRMLKDMVESNNFGARHYFKLTDEFHSGYRS